METPVVPNALRRAILAELVDVGNFLDGCCVRMFSNDVSPGPETVIGDLTECTFTGYAASSAIVWGAPYTDTLGVAHVTGGSKQFTQTADTVNNIAYGYYVTTTGGSPALKYAVRFDEPVAFNGPGVAKVVVPDFPYSGN